MWRLIRRIFLGLLVLLVLVMIVAVATPQGRTAARTAMFIPQVLPAIPVKPQEWFTADPVRKEVMYPLAEGEGVADLYLPSGNGPHSAVLLFLGVNPAGRNDSRVVGLASGLARAGMVVMLPWSETMTEKRIDTMEIDNLVWGFEYLRTVESVDPDRMGMGGFCVGASMAAVAATDERIRHDVKFVNFFGGYYDAADLVKAVVTKSRFHDGQAEDWSPDKLSVEVVRTHLIEGVPNDDDRRLLEQVFLEGHAVAAADLADLSPDARAAYRLLSGPEIDQVDALIKALSPETRESLRLISPSNQIDRLEARILVMHDREDDLVPSEESRRLVDALGAEQNAYYTEFSFFQHVDPTRSVAPHVYAREAFKLFLHMYNILRVGS